MAEELMQQLRSKATELLLREEWKESLQVYSQLITLCQDQISTTHQPRHVDHLPKLRKFLCLAFSNRAEAQFRLRNHEKALNDCDEALKIEGSHFKTLLCKGKILLNLSRYSVALECFKSALTDPQANGYSENLNGYVEKCKKLDLLSKTGAFDISDWIANGFRGKIPELAEYIGAVQIKKSGISGRGLFATKNIESGTLIFVTKAISTDRGILPEEENPGENAQLVMWKNFIEKVRESAKKCQTTQNLLSTLSIGETEENLEVPDINLFRPETEQINTLPNQNLDLTKILTILDANSLVENSDSSKVLGRNSDYYGVGLWILPSFINHSCIPNSLRIHVGDYAIVHASRDIKAGEELTFSYFNPFSQVEKRKEMSNTWDFNCKCKRCMFEEQIWKREEMREIEIAIERGVDLGQAVYKLEEGMRRWMVRGKEKGYLRASYWGAYCQVYSSEKLMKKWGRRIPAVETVVDSVVEVVGSHERVVKVLVDGFRRNGGGVVEMERIMKLGRGVFGKIVKKKAMKILLQLG